MSFSKRWFEDVEGAAGVAPEETPSQDELLWPLLERIEKEQRSRAEDDSEECRLFYPGDETALNDAIDAHVTRTPPHPLDGDDDE